MNEFGWDKYWDWLRFFSLKQWGNSVETCFEIVWQWFRWSDVENRLRRVLKLSQNVFVEAMRNFGWNKFSKNSDNIFVEVMKNAVYDVFWNFLRMFSLKRWGFSAETSFETVWKYFRWSDEEIQLRRVLKLSYNVSRWSDEGIRLRQVLRVS